MTKNEDKIARFKEWIVARGAELLIPTNEWEAVRFRAGDTTSIVYLNKKGRLAFTGQATAAWAAFTSRTDFRFVEKTPRVRMNGVVNRTILERDGSRCFYCDTEFTDACPPTREHLVPRTAGGPDHISNLFLACEACNREVGHKSAPEKIRYRDAKRRFAEHIETLAAALRRVNNVIFAVGAPLGSELYFQIREAAVDALRATHQPISTKEDELNG